MKIRSSMLCVAAASALVLGAVMPVQAQTSTFRTSTSSTSMTTETAARVAVRGLVTGAPETVAFSGFAQVLTRVITDPDFGNPANVVLMVDLSGVSGTGTTSKRTYVITSRHVIQRTLTAADAVELSFPFALQGRELDSARVGSAALSLSFDVNTGQMTGASASVGNP